MKSLLKLTAFIICSLMLVAITISWKVKYSFDYVLTELGLSKEMANSYINNSFYNGTFNVPTLKAAYQWSTGRRKEAILEIGKYAKAYTASPEFRRAYEQYQAMVQPAVKNTPILTFNQKLKTIIDELKEEIKSDEKEMEETDQETVKSAFKAGIEYKKSRLKVLEDPNDKHHAVHIKQLKSEHQAEVGRLQKNRHNSTVPTDSKVIIKNMLKEFLTMSATVDYNAVLMQRGDKMVFVKEEYENKSENWKKCFRAGKEVTEVARTFAQNWLNELK